MSQVKQNRSAAPVPQQQATAVQMLMAENFKPQIQAALPKHMSPDRMLRISLTELRKTPKLNECDPMSLLGAIVQSAQLGLEPGSALGHAYLVPFYNNKTGRHEVQLIPGYKGLIDLARRSGQIAAISARCVYENDKFDFSYGLNERLDHVPAKSDRGALIYVYAVAKLRDGSTQMEVMSMDEVERVRALSKSKDFGPWKDHYDEMARKTAVRRLAKYLPLSPEMVRTIELDNDQFDGNSQGLHAVIDANYSIPPAEHDPAKIVAEQAAGANGAAHATPQEQANADADTRIAKQGFLVEVEGVRRLGGDPEKILKMSVDNVLALDANTISHKAALLADWGAEHAAPRPN